MTKRKDVDLQIGKIISLLKTQFVFDLLNHILLNHERSLDVYVRSDMPEEASFRFDIKLGELNEILGNLEYYYKKNRLLGIELRKLFVSESPIHKNGCPFTFEEWVDRKIENLELNDNEKETFKLFDQLVEIPL